MAVLPERIFLKSTAGISQRINEEMIPKSNYSGPSVGLFLDARRVLPPRPSIQSVSVDGPLGVRRECIETSIEDLSSYS